METPVARSRGSEAFRLAQERRTLEARERAERVIEDGTFLADHGVASTEAARRLGMASVNAMEKYLYRLGRGDLWLRLKYNGRRDLDEG